MKRKIYKLRAALIITLANLLISSSIFAQAPEKMSYQAVIRDASDKLVSGKSIGIRISILKGSENGSIVYEETQTPVTNANGLVSIQIGTGNSSSDFSDIYWGEGPYFLKSEVDIEGGANYAISGTSEILSVPFALCATTAENVIEEKQNLSDVVRNLNYANGQIKNLDNPTEARDAVTKEYVTLRISTLGDTLFLGDQFVIIPNINSANVKVPVVKISALAEVSLESATLTGEITDNCWGKISAYGFIVSENKELTDSTVIKLDEITEIGVFTEEVDSLFSSTQYYYKAFASNSKGIAFSEVDSFITTSPLLAITPVSARVSEVIGKGYDITGRYANSFSIMSPILNYTQLLDRLVIHLDSNQYSGENKAVSGSTLSQYQNELSVYAGVEAAYGGFSGEIKTNYQSDKTGSSAYSFATKSSKQIKSAFLIDKKISLNMDSLRRFVKPEFVADAGTLKPEDFLKKYGTDVLLGGMWGGRADYNFSAKKTASSDGTNIGAYAEASYHSVYGSAGGSVDVDSKYQKSFETSTVYSAVTARGGNPSTITSWADLKTWQESITEDNQVFMEFYPGCVLPVYELVSNPEVREKIKSARNSLILEKGIPTDDTPLYQTINYDFCKTGFTKHQGTGDDDIYSKSNRETNVVVTLSVKKENSNSIKCTVILKVREVSPDNTEYSGTCTFSIPTEYQLLDFPEKRYSENLDIEGSHHDFVTIPVQNNSWLPNLSVQFDSNSDDQKSIGVKGELLLNLPFRNPNW